MANERVLLGAASDVGRRRDHNEDAYTTFTTAGGLVVCVVADGMGGHLAGEVASARTVEIVERELAPSTADAFGAAEALRAAIETANREIWREAQEDVTKAGMGSTVVAAILTDL
jgi:protein phosphatase